MNLTPAVQCGSIAISQGSRIDIEMHNLSFRYPQCETVTLRNISLQIKAGEKVAFVGANGAGKSTLIKLLSRLYEPTNGQLLISGKDISLYDTTAYRSAVSVVFQNFQTYAFTIAENILMRPIENSSDEKTVVDSLKAVGLYQKIQNFPNGIYSVLSREFSNTGVTLSGGEIQKLAIARVYAQNSSIIILDEPTSGLDPFSEKALLTQLLNDTDGKTLILISHRLSNLVDVDKIYFIDGGQLIESGSHSELMHANGAYAEMFRLQAQDYLKGD